jgi:hypothetical protein
MVNTINNNTRLRCVSLKVPPNTLPVAKQEVFRPTFFARKSPTIVRDWPKAEKPLRRNISSGHWGAADAICSL